MSYFRRKAEQCYHHAELITGPQSDGESIQSLGDEFTAKADAAVTRLTHGRDTVARRGESERQRPSWDRREWNVDYRIMAHPASDVTAVQR